MSGQAGAVRAGLKWLRSNVWHGAMAAAKDAADYGLALGEAMAKALADKRGMERYEGIRVEGGKH